MYNMSRWLRFTVRRRNDCAHPDVELDEDVKSFLDTLSDRQHALAASQAAASPCSVAYPQADADLGLVSESFGDSDSTMAFNSNAAVAIGKGLGRAGGAQHKTLDFLSTRGSDHGEGHMRGLEPRTAKQIEHITQWLYDLIAAQSQLADRFDEHVHVGDAVVEHVEVRINTNLEACWQASRDIESMLEDIGRRHGVEARFAEERFVAVTSQLAAFAADYREEPKHDVDLPSAGSDAEESSAESRSEEGGAPQVAHSARVALPRSSRGGLGAPFRSPARVRHDSVSSEQSPQSAGDSRAGSESADSEEDQQSSACAHTSSAESRSDSRAREVDAFMVRAQGHVDAYFASPEAQASIGNLAADLVDIISRHARPLK